MDSILNLSAFSKSNFQKFMLSCLQGQMYVPKWLIPPLVDYSIATLVLVLINSASICILRNTIFGYFLARLINKGSHLRTFVSVSD